MKTTETTPRYHVTICGFGQDAETREDAQALLNEDEGWQEEGEYATVLDRQTGEVFTVC